MSLAHLEGLYNEGEAQAQPDFSILPTGVYTGIIDKCEFKLVGTNQTPKLALTLKVHGGNHNGRLIFWDQWLTAKTVLRFKGLVASLGITLSGIREIETHEGRAKFIGIPVEVKATVKEELYNGEKTQYHDIFFRNRVELPPSQLETPPAQATAPQPAW